LRRLVRASNIDVALTLGGVGLVNMAIMCIAAVTFGAAGSAGDASIEGAYRMLGPLFGGMSAAIFMVSLLASGRVELGRRHHGRASHHARLRRFAHTLVRAAARNHAANNHRRGMDCRRDAGVSISQVVLSFVLPIPLITLVLFTASPSIMGRLANSRVVSAFAIGGTAIVLSLNVLLLVRMWMPE
jgi:manganese transport protein